MLTRACFILFNVTSRFILTQLLTLLNRAPSSLAPCDPNPPLTWLVASITSRSTVAAAPIGRRSIYMSILNVQSEEVSCTELRLRPQPFVIDQTFRFHQSENEVHTLASPSLRTMAIARCALRSLKLRCPPVLVAVSEDHRAAAKRALALHRLADAPAHRIRLPRPSPRAASLLRRS